MTVPRGACPLRALGALQRRGLSAGRYETPRRTLSRRDRRRCAGQQDPPPQWSGVGRGNTRFASSTGAVYADGLSSSPPHIGLLKGWASVEVAVPDKSQPSHDIVVVGSGFFGLTIAERVASQLGRR